jgi:hypothetical protein
MMQGFLMGKAFGLWMKGGLLHMGGFWKGKGLLKGENEWLKGNC